MKNSAIYQLFLSKLHCRKNFFSAGKNFIFTNFLLILQKSGSLQVHVHEAKGLPGGDLPDPPDPYVKLYLLPERSKKSKRKSDAKKDTVTPVFDETFDYDVEVLKMNSELEVSNGLLDEVKYVRKTV